jgi:hypothetical protein
MKKLKALVCCIAFNALYLCASAQNGTIPPLNEPDYKKPKIFADLPQQMVLKVSEAAKLFNQTAGSLTSVQLTNEFFVKGTIVSNGGNNSTQTVILTIPNRNNSVLTITRIIKNNGSKTYVGRIMNRNNGDAYIINAEDDQFVLKKINLYDLIGE